MFEDEQFLFLFFPFPFLPCKSFGHVDVKISHQDIRLPLLAKGDQYSSKPLNRPCRSMRQFKAELLEVLELILNMPSAINMIWFLWLAFTALEQPPPLSSSTTTQIRNCSLHLFRLDR
jgi:hypothetical protein